MYVKFFKLKQSIIIFNIIYVSTHFRKYITLGKYYEKWATKVLMRSFHGCFWVLLKQWMKREQHFRLFYRVNYLIITPNTGEGTEKENND